MGEATRPVFIVSSGRSGTKMMERLFSAYQSVEMHHEYMVHHIQPLAVRYALGLTQRNEVINVLTLCHRAAVYYSDKPIWGDTSNKLIWLIDVLDELFPSARFVHLVRDGRKVTSSYFHKLADECYDDRSTRILAEYIDRYPVLPPPPPEKRFWWPQPRRGSPQRKAFLGYSQFERIAWHWAEAHRTALDQLTRVPSERQHFVRLEDLISDMAEQRRLARFLGLDDRPEMFSPLAKPHNVNQPRDYPLTADETLRFFAIAEEMMARLGYAGTSEYAVNY